MILPSEQKAVESQAEEFNQAISPALATASKSTVRLWSGSRKLSYGTVVGDGSKILTKWSELLRAKSKKIQVDTGNGYHFAKLIGVYYEEDLALLEVEGPPLTPVKWSTEPLNLGSFIAAPQPDGRLASFGVVSVLERNLRDTDLAYLGVVGNPDYDGPGLMIADVAEKSGAKTAGLKKNDIILKVGSREISGLLELKNALIGVQPGETISLLISRNGTEEKVDVLLGNRPDLPESFNARVAQMERMGGDISRVRDSFTRAIQTDMRPKPNQVGGPVADLKGRIVGITIARADRTRSFIMPAAAVMDLLDQQPDTPAAAEAKLKAQNAKQEALASQTTRPDGRMIQPPGAGRAFPTEKQMRNHLGNMERIIEHLQAEMEALEAMDEPTR
ncbi:MAG: PDZ domain-containing protein [Akkermansiaceae bacterium]|nr:PDZ domain-containing protein [Akkermansiaceae bacterium]